MPCVDLGGRPRQPCSDCGSARDEPRPRNWCGAWPPRGWRGPRIVPLCIACKRTKMAEREWRSELVRGRDRRLAVACTTCEAAPGDPCRRFDRARTPIQRGVHNARALVAQRAAEQELRELLENRGVAA